MTRRAIPDRFRNLPESVSTNTHVCTQGKIIPDYRLFGRNLLFPARRDKEWREPPVHSASYIGVCLHGSDRQDENACSRNTLGPEPRQISDTINPMPYQVQKGRGTWKKYSVW